MLRRTLTALAVTGILVATPAGALAALRGPDVSHYQHVRGAGIGWTAVKVAGHSFVFHKATGGTTYVDPTFRRDWARAKAAGLMVGAYHYARPAGGARNAAAQARHFIAVVGTTRHRGELPPVLDIETTGGLNPAQLIRWTRAFLTTVRRLTGRTPIVYSYPSFWRTAMAGTRAFRNYPLWGACYCSRPTTFGGAWKHWTFWQYSNHSSVRGIAGKSDMNRFNGTWAQLRRLASGRPDRATKVGTVLAATVPASSRVGSAFRIRGTLRTKGGSPVAARRVVILERRIGTRHWFVLARLRTSRTGAWSARLRAPHGVQVVARFAGDRGAVHAISPVLAVDRHH